MVQRWRLLVVGLVLFALVVCGLSTAGPPGDEPLVGNDLYQEVDVDRTTMEIHLDVDGSARWTVEHRVRLDDQESVRGFERTRSRVESNRSAFREPFARRIRTMATTAEADTDRTMVVENVTVDAYREQVPREYGVVAYEFRWYGFADPGDQLRVGDALSGLFLDEETTLVISWPTEVDLAQVIPEPDDRRERAVVWNGPLEFATGEPQVVLESDTLSFGPDLTFDAGGDDVLVTLAAFAVLLVVPGAGVVVWRRRRTGDEPADATDSGDDAPQDGEGTPDDSAGTDPESTAAAATSPEVETEGTTGDAAQDTAGDADAPDTAGDTDEQDGETGGPSQPTPTEDLLSNEEQVLQLLDEHGGRMKQQEIVETLDWSETKTSEVVSGLREDEVVDVYRLGRENVLALPEVGLGIDDESGEGDG